MLGKDFIKQVEISNQQTGLITKNNPNRSTLGTHEESLVRKTEGTRQTGRG